MQCQKYDAWIADWDWERTAVQFQLNNVSNWQENKILNMNGCTDNMNIPNVTTKRETDQNNQPRLKQKQHNKGEERISRRCSFTPAQSILLFKHTRCWTWPNTSVLQSHWGKLPSSETTYLRWCPVSSSPAHCVTTLVFSTITLKDTLKPRVVHN